jgi:uncharacterized protein (DUF39 family)
MSPEYIKGASFTGYGSTLIVGIGVPIPVLDEEMAYLTSRTDDDLYAQIVDYSEDYPNRVARSLGEASYAQLRSGKIVIDGKEVPTFPISSYSKARVIASTLKEWITSGNFSLSNPVAPLPGVGSGIKMKVLEDRELPQEKSAARA